MINSQSRIPLQAARKGFSVANRRSFRHKRGTLKIQNGAWILKYYDEDGKQRTATCPLGRASGPNKITKSEAQAWQDEVMMPLNAKRSGRMGEVSFQWFTENVYFTERRDPDLESVRQGTDKNDRQRFNRYIFPLIGSIRLQDLTQDDLVSMLKANRQKGYGQEILSKVRGDVMRVCRKAYGKQYLSHQIWEGLEKAKSIKQKRIKRTVSYAELETICELLEPRDQAAFHLMVFGGLRQSEVFGLKVGDIGERGLRVRRSVYKGVEGPCKTDNSRRPAGLNSFTMNLITAHIERLPDRGADAWLFPSTAITTWEWPENAMKNRIRPLLAKAGFAWVSWEVLRYTFVTNASKHGSNTAMSAFQAGHDRDTATKYYVQFGEADLADENEKLYNAVVSKKGTDSE